MSARTAAATETVAMFFRQPFFCTALLALICALPAPATAVSCYPQHTPSTPDQDFDASANGTARHLPTGLIWMRCNLGQSWNGATCVGSPATFTSWGVGLRTVRDINTGVSDLDGDGAPGFADERDWRMPNIKEWRSIHETCRYNPAMNDAIFPNAPIAAIHYASTTDDKSPATFVYFDTQFGTTGVTLKDDAIPRMMRLVRGGQRGGDYGPPQPLFSDGFE
ncbi:DUF1566 domain-containing protein [Xanthomonadaceae bacterium XH05]|nr:DUF1566 domain-containing protein [Xanthomonadaceae bacterium XH05]